ncbi:MAG: DUF4834 family protein [Bacteroidetes bacterium]|nr:DUF4834 family protein [Bacteroidota bacterium]
MIKAIIYVVVIYFIIKIYRAFSRAKVIVKQYHYHDNRQYNGTQEEGKVTLKENPAGKAGSSHKSLESEGDYVDFEEVKD